MGPCRPKQSSHSTAGKQFIQNLVRVTPGSTGLDLGSSTYTELTPEMGVQALPMGVYGPLPPGSVGLVLGRSNSLMRGLIVAPGIIDLDFTGEVKIMMSSPYQISVLQPGQRIAQILLIPVMNTANKSKRAICGAEGFTSSDAYWIQKISKDRPELNLWING